MTIAAARGRAKRSAAARLRPQLLISALSDFFEAGAQILQKRSRPIELYPGPWPIDYEVSLGSNGDLLMVVFCVDGRRVRAPFWVIGVMTLLRPAGRDDDRCALRRAHRWSCL